MKNPANLKSIALVAALAAVAATSWAMNESVSVTSNDTHVVAAPVPVVTQNEEVVTVADTVPAPVAIPVAAPIATPVAEAQPSVTIEERRLSVDERIQADVMDAILKAPNISGKIGVESRDSVVTLTGYTITPGMANRAGRYAGGVQGVRYVQNELRTRIGGSI